MEEERKKKRRTKKEEKNEERREELSRWEVWYYNIYNIKYIYYNIFFNQKYLFKIYKLNIFFI